MILWDSPVVTTLPSSLPFGRVILPLLPVFGPLFPVSYASASLGSYLWDRIDPWGKSCNSHLWNQTLIFHFNLFFNQSRWLSKHSKDTDRIIRLSQAKKLCPALSIFCLRADLFGEYLRRVLNACSRWYLACSTMIRWAGRKRNIDANSTFPQVCAGFHYLSPRGSLRTWLSSYFLCLTRGYSWRLLLWKKSPASPLNDDNTAAKKADERKRMAESHTLGADDPNLTYSIITHAERIGELRRVNQTRRDGEENKIELADNACVSLRGVHHNT